MQKTLEALAGAFAANDEVSLWRFDEVPEQCSEDFIADNDKLLTTLKHIDLSTSFPGIGSYAMTAGPRVNTAQPPGPATIPAEANGHPNTKHIDDAIFAAADQLLSRPRDRRKIIFLISDGQNAKNNAHKYAETVKLLLSQDRYTRSAWARPTSTAELRFSGTTSWRSTRTQRAATFFTAG